jgi:hypothetical protein
MITQRGILTCLLIALATVAAGDVPARAGGCCRQVARCGQAITQRPAVLLEISFKRRRAAVRGIRHVDVADRQREFQAGIAHRALGPTA